MSPYFFAVYIDDIVYKVASSGTGCYIGLVCFSIILYADDILLLAPSISSLQRLLTICEQELRLLDLAININKSVCTRIGPKYADNECSGLKTLDGNHLQWVDNLRYLGIYIVAGKTFRCCFDNAKKSFYRAFNAIFGKIGRSASEEVILSLVQSKCLPCLLYGVDVCPLNKTDLRSLEFPVIKVLMKLFRTSSLLNIREYQQYFSFPSVEACVNSRRLTFLHKYCAVNNLLCITLASNAIQQL